MSQLQYCNILFSSLDKCNLTPVISKQNAAAKHPHPSSSSDHVNLSLYPSTSLSSFTASNTTSSSPSRPCLFALTVQGPALTTHWPDASTHFLNFQTPFRLSPHLEGVSCKHCNSSWNSLLLWCLQKTMLSLLMALPFILIVSFYFPSACPSCLNV